MPISAFIRLNGKSKSNGKFKSFFCTANVEKTKPRRHRVKKTELRRQSQPRRPFKRSKKRTRTRCAL